MFCGAVNVEHDRAPDNAEPTEDDPPTDTVKLNLAGV